MTYPKVLMKKHGLDLNWIFLCLSLVVSGGLGQFFENGTNLPSWVSGIYSEPTKNIPGPEKNFTGIEVKNDSIRVVYHHGQTVAVVEVAPNRELFNCELLEVRTERDKAVALNSLKPIVPIQMETRFQSMMELMRECQKLDPPVNLLDTKWCGTGDIADSYHDLGKEKQEDKCCRNHDFCPIKVASLKTQYNITNLSIYTKSHCDCDEDFYNCLKSVGSTTSNLLGTIYFNVAKVSCVEHEQPDLPNSGQTKLRFSSKRKEY